MVANDNKSATIPPRPDLVDVITENIPTELKERPQWVLWRWCWRDGKWTKPPHQTNAQYADATNPAHWCTFAEAFSAYKLEQWDPHGIGFVFTADDPFCGIDLDNTYDDFGNISPWPQPHKRWLDGAPEPQKILDGLGSYWEISPGSHGVKAIVQAVAPCSGKAGPFELYDRGRYFTVTGQCIGKPLPIQCRQKNVDRLCELFLPVLESNTPDTEESAQTDTPAAERVLRLAFAATGGDKLKALYEGAWETDYSSQSEADLALCGKLAFWCGNDPGVLDTLFRDSALFRDKWDSRRGSSTYGQQTVARALAGCKEFYQWDQPEAAEQPTEEADEDTEPEVPAYIFRPFSQITRKAVSWLWQDYLPTGKPVVVAGDPGAGKTTLLCHLAAAITTGKLLPGGAVCATGDVAYLTAEDDVHDTLRPKMEDMGADLDRVHELTLPEDTPFYLREHQAVLADVLEKHPEVRLIVMDTVSQFFDPEVDPHQKRDVAQLLQIVTRLATKHDCGFALIEHVNKNTAASSIYRVQGSIGLVGAARVLWRVRVETEGKRKLWVVKTNCGRLPQPAYFLIDDTGCLQWTVEDSTAGDRCCEWLREYLTQNPEARPMQILQAAREAGHSKNAAYDARDKICKEGSWELCSAG